MSKFEDIFSKAPVVAILRGLKPEEAIDVASALIEGGIKIMEVPLNSPDPFDSIERIAKQLGDVVCVGAGTVLKPAQVNQLKDCGGEFVVAPNFSLEVGAASQKYGLSWLPGIYTPTEAFAALDAGADGLKLFPAELCPPAIIRAFRAVIPKEIKLLPVGGVDVSNIADYMKAGASGAGIGSSLFRPGTRLDAITAHAKALMANVKLT
ncbi:2-dehydro-3-deoxy-6-phosphogalactonate aldolase [Pseudovibrio sp. Ad13]|uniref:2-dehydro-3-deoxy-6-phosphogalactonate aldolase n=1 Tax=Pseudovibrio sp. Ad13 TaxID=989396 RepID=UPI0007AEC66D|nr:2-dehydro-3-deoxy-6-phosphogalactonate aldolase [Pseudovibrio sp. Ad13]KZK75592.1 2-dehydro-3-deoxy-6-phosphogalactonate aldolase [Pseudovibrio sp. Ad13]